jgi:hypothetical protein
MKNILVSMLVVLGLSFASVGFGKDWKSSEEATVDDFRDLMKDAKVIASHYDDGSFFELVISHPDYGLLWCIVRPVNTWCSQAGNRNQFD